MEQYLNNPWFWALVIWSFIWKGFALWRAGSLNHRGWFIALYVINTAGLLEMAYIFFFSDRSKELVKLPKDNS